MTDPLKFANKSAVQDNPLLKLIYMSAYPLALFAKKIGITPNGVTGISFVFTLFAFTALVSNNHYGFLIFWFVAFILDFVDGTLARMTNLIGGTALELDHVSDIVKISIIFLGFGFYFNTTFIWMLTFVSSGLYLFYTFLNHELSWIKKFNSVIATRKMSDTDSDQTIDKDSKSGLRRFIKSRPKLKKGIITLKVTFLTIHAHTLLIFFLIPLHNFLAYTLLTYFMCITLFQSSKRIIALNKLQRIRL